MKLAGTNLPYLLLAAVMLTLAWLPESVTQLLQYQHTSLEQGQIWRLISGHLLHSNYWHLLMNLAGLLLVMLLHGHYWRWQNLLLQWLSASVLISIALYLFSPEIVIYVGLSSLLHAMLTIGALKDIQLKMKTGWLLLAGLIIKVGYEQWHGPDQALAELINASVATDAHLFGVMSGLLIALMQVVTASLKRDR